jgi:hypothetical protein
LILGNQRQAGAEIFGGVSMAGSVIASGSTRHELPTRSVSMNAFRTSCGTALTADALVRTGCGKPARSAESPANSRRWPWILALILLFVLGFLLGRLMAPKWPHCPAPPSAGNGSGGGGRGHGAGHPESGPGGGAGPGGGGSVGSGNGTGDMTGGGTGNIDGTTVGHGYDGSAVGANGADDGGGGGGKGNPGDSPNGPLASDPDAKRTEAGVWSLAAGAPLSANGLAAPQAGGKGASVKVLSAPDFRYDKTGLPRCPDANKAGLSAMSYGQDGRTDTYNSSSGIITTSAFGEVVNRYRKNLPPGWSDSTVSDLNRLGAVAQQLSPDKVMQMLSAAPAKAVAETPSTAAAERMRLSMFAAPAGTQGDLGVMLVQRGDKPVEIFMKTRGAL